tara:strand:- start:376 stop:621 length:246 start_codon:yes stop_codon:yes gene_type:complete
MEIMDNQNKALSKLKALASEARAKGKGIEIDIIIKTVIGTNYDSEFESYVRIALESYEGAMTLEEIVKGILSLKEWQIRLT